MIHPIPSGTRDVLPDEMRELRAITEAMRGVFERRGYGEVWTPAIEYEDVLRRGETGGRPGLPACSTTTAQVLALRSDMTVPIARVVGHALRERRAAAALLLLRARLPRRCARTAGRCASSCRPGIELVGAPGPDGTAEALTVLCEALDAVGPARLPDRRWATRRCTRRCWTAFDVPPRTRARAAARRSARATSSAWSARSARARRCDDDAAVRVPQLRGGPEVLEAPIGRRPTRRAACARCSTLLEPAVAERVIFDLGLARGLGYYTGAVFDVYDPALGEPLGGGGRYDDLLGALRARRCRRSASRCDVDRLHIALAGEEAAA